MLELEKHRTHFWLKIRQKINRKFQNYYKVSEKGKMWRFVPKKEQFLFR